MRSIALTSIGLAGLLVSGCSSFSSANYGYQITYPKYVEILAKDAESLARRGNADDLYEAGKIFMKIGRIERAEGVAEALLENKRNFALNLYDELQRYRDSHPSKK
ncbi:hypothetical protein HYV88_00820 [Candidatus Woesearchaeota archaeon]|nr:hypothetical protein [Candidatus Woesearchaeota archaeon]